MKKFTLKKKEGGQVLGKEVKEAHSFGDRLLGLMFKEKMEGADGLWIKPCNSIHTFFMRFPIDVVFLDDQVRIVAIYRNLAPWRFTRMFFKARSVLELPGSALGDQIKVGDQLEVVCTN